MLLPALSKCLPHLVVFITLISGEEGEHDVNELCWVPFSLSLLSLKAVQAGLLRLSEFRPKKGATYLPESPIALGAAPHGCLSYR